MPMLALQPAIVHVLLIKLIVSLLAIKIQFAFLVVVATSLNVKIPNVHVMASAMMVVHAVMKPVIAQTIQNQVKISKFSFSNHQRRMPAIPNKSDSAGLSLVKAVNLENTLSVMLLSKFLLPWTKSEEECAISLWTEKCTLLEAATQVILKLLNRTVFNRFLLDHPSNIPFRRRNYRVDKTEVVQLPDIPFEMQSGRCINYDGESVMFTASWNKERISKFEIQL